MNEDWRIDITNNEDLKKWCTELQCDEQDLIHAVLRIGSRVKSVNDFLILNRKKNNECD